MPLKDGYLPSFNGIQALGVFIVLALLGLPLLALFAQVGFAVLLFGLVGLPLIGLTSNVVMLGYVAKSALLHDERRFWLTAHIVALVILTVFCIEQGSVFIKVRM